MIFVTVGTHEQQFNRLVEYIDNMKRDALINEEVVIQVGYSTYEPKSCIWQKFYSYQQMVEFINEARIVITHGGPSSFIMTLQAEKIPIVVPRQKQFDEHVNDHQVTFAKAVAERQGNLIVSEDINNLRKILINYDSIIRSMSTEMKSNNVKFNDKICKIVDDLFSKGKR